MAFHNINPAREQLRAEMLATLANSREPMTTGAIYEQCPSAVDAADVARLAYEMKKKGLIADGGKVLHALGMHVNSYILSDQAAPRIDAAKPVVVERKIPRTIKPPKPAQDHPFKARIVAQEAHDGPPRVTRDLPQHLQSPAPQLAADGIHHHLLEEAMSEDPVQYIPDPDAFSLEPSEPEAKEDIDSELVDALMEMEMANLKPKEKAIADMLAMASGDVDDIAAAMSKRHESAPKKVCKCIRLNSLPPLPSGYRFASIVASIFSEHYGETMDVYVVDEGGGPFVKIYTTGALGFGLGDLALIGEAADALIKLMESDHA
jgi:hypothetical protein